jgi:hypothetical protein
MSDHMYQPRCRNTRGATRLAHLRILPAVPNPVEFKPNPRPNEQTPVETQMQDELRLLLGPLLWRVRDWSDIPEAEWCILPDDTSSL